MLKCRARLAQRLEREIAVTHPVLPSLGPSFESVIGLTKIVIFVLLIPWLMAWVSKHAALEALYLGAPGRFVPRAFYMSVPVLAVQKWEHQHYIRRVKVEMGQPDFNVTQNQMTVKYYRVSKLIIEGMVPP